MIGGFIRYNLSCSKAVSASSDQEKRSEALRSLKNGSPFSLRRDIKRLRAAMQPVTFCMSFYTSWSFHVGDGGDLVGVGLNATGADDVAQEYAGWNSKDEI